MDERTRALARFRRWLAAAAATLLLADLDGFASSPKKLLAVVGATLIDVSNAGHASADVDDSVVLILEGRVAQVGDRAHLHVPARAQVIDAKGRFLIPGLIEGYGAVRTQGFADAYLYEGVTTVIVPSAPQNAAIDGEPRIFAAKHGPSILISTPLSGYSADGDIPKASPWLEHRTKDLRLDGAALRAQIAHAAATGSRVIAAGQDVWPEQLDVIVSEAHRLGLAVTAQLAFTTYPYAVRAGVDAFTRNDRYSLTLSGPEDFQAYADDPMGAGGRPAVRAVCHREALGDAISAFGAQLAASNTALMPVLSMEATADDVGSPNPWTLRSAAFVSPGDLDDPVDPGSGARPYLLEHPDARERLQACARSKQAIDRELRTVSAPYIWPALPLLRTA